MTHFGTAPDGTSVELVRISKAGTTASILTWGAVLQDFRRQGLAHSLVLGSSELEAYLGPMRYFGAVVGPVANRVANGRFTIDGVDFALDKNEGNVTTLHGGSTGISQKNWSVESRTETSCTLSIVHADGEGGFPGNKAIKVTYSIDDDGALRVDMTVETDATTYCNLAFHGYWNLDGKADTSAHKLQVRAQNYLPVDGQLIPLGSPKPVAGTEFDYTCLRKINFADGKLLDHNYCLDKKGRSLLPICALEAGEIRLEIESTELGLQVYGGTGINTGDFVGHSGQAYARHAGIALEPQNWPDAPNRTNYPSALLKPGERYEQTSVFRVIVDAVQD